MGNKSEQVKGRVEEAVGALTDDKGLNGGRPLHRHGPPLRRAASVARKH